MFDCPNCKRNCKKLIAVERQPKLHCENCFERQEARPTYLHDSFPGAESKERLTIAKANVIGRRMICPEDKMVVLDRKTKRETQY